MSMSVPTGNCVMTVQGPLASKDLGFCHSHEHLFIAAGESAKIDPALQIDSLEKTLAELTLFKKVGGNSIVDAQPLGCGRMAQQLLKASLESEINIIAATGFHKLIFYPQNHWLHTLNVLKLTQLFCSEFNYGMYSDGETSLPCKRVPAKPGIIKTASDTEGITAKYRKLFEAAATTSQETGMPILSHTEMGKAALQQIEFFGSYGLTPQSVIICHLDRNLSNWDYHLEVARTGAFLECDTIGRFKYHSDEAEARYICDLVEHGYEDQILLGLDVTNRRLKSYGSPIGLDYIVTEFIPLLKKYGLESATVEKFVITNPAKAFCNSKINKRLLMKPNATAN